MPWEPLPDASDPIKEAITEQQHSQLSGQTNDDHTQYLKEKNQGGLAAEVPTHDHSAAGEAGTIDHGSLTGTGDDDHSIYLNTTRHDSDDHSGLEEVVTFFKQGTLAVTTGTFRWYPPFSIDIVDVRAAVGTAPTGASILVDVNRNGTSIFTSQGNRPTIAASSNFDVSGTPDGTTGLTGDADYVTVDIDQVGSTVEGSDLTVMIAYKRT